MKIRIKGNSIRMRLSKSEVNRLGSEGYLEEQTQFVGSALIYALRSMKDTEQLSADFSDNKITVFAPEAFLKSWPQNEVVGIDANMPLLNTGSLYILIEKDFVCLDATSEDQSDNFENPNKTC